MRVVVFVGRFWREEREGVVLVAGVVSSGVGEEVERRLGGGMMGRVGAMR